jgi:hypothetical protein
VHLQPRVARAAEARIEQLGELPLSRFVSILLWNAVHAGVPATIDPKAEEPIDTQVREQLPISVDANLHRAASKLAARLDCTFSRLAEVLIVDELRSPERGLTIWPAVGQRKPTIR